MGSEASSAIAGSCKSRMAMPSKVLRLALIHLMVSLEISSAPPVSFVTHAGNTVPSPTSQMLTLMSGTTALMASAHSRHVSNIQRRRIDMGSFISSAAKADGCPTTASAMSFQYRTNAARPSPGFST